jgi:hypothetical protein
MVSTCIRQAFRRGAGQHCYGGREGSRSPPRCRQLEGFSDLRCPLVIEEGWGEGSGGMLRSIREVVVREFLS